MYSTFASMLPGFSKGRWVSNREITLSLDSCCHWLMIPVEGIERKKRRRELRNRQIQLIQGTDRPWQGKYDTTKGCLHV